MSGRQEFWVSPRAINTAAGLLDIEASRSIDGDETHNVLIDIDQHGNARAFIAGFGMLPTGTPNETIPVRIVTVPTVTLDDVLGAIG